MRSPGAATHGRLERDDDTLEPSRSHSNGLRGPDVPPDAQESHFPAPKPSDPRGGSRKGASAPLRRFLGSGTASSTIGRPRVTTSPPGGALGSVPAPAGGPARRSRHGSMQGPRQRSRQGHDRGRCTGPRPGRTGDTRDGRRRAASRLHGIRGGARATPGAPRLPAHRQPRRGRGPAADPADPGGPRWPGAPGETAQVVPHGAFGVPCSRTQLSRKVRSKRE